MHWRAPLWLWALPLVGVLAVVLLTLVRRRVQALATFAEAPLAARLTPHVDRRRPRWRAGLRVAALVCLVVALAGPQYGFEWQEMRREGLDIIVALDTSRSMLATDVKPNRLERARLAILDLVPLLHGDRIGLVPFAGSAFLECPLTLDYAAFERSLRAIEVGIIPRGGTSLSSAIDTALAGFEAREGKYEALILITDGEDHEGEAKAAAERARARGVQIFTVGIGTPDGELLPLGTDGYVKDRSGQVVKSRLNEQLLTDIAVTTGGAYAQGIGPSLGLDQVFRDHIAPMERRSVASALQRRMEERFQWPLAAALLLLALEATIAPRRGARPARRRAWRRDRARAAAVAVCLPFLVGFLDPPGDRAAEGNRLFDAGQYEQAASAYGEGLIDAPASPLLQFNLAAALYRQEKYDEALAMLERVLATGEPEWIGRAAYNAGNARYRIGAAQEDANPQAAIAAWEQALVDYKRAMVADPGDQDAKFNHELVARRIAELKKKLEEEQQRKDEEQEQQEQDQQEQQEQQEQQQQDQQQQEEQQQEEQQEQEQPQDHEDQQQDQQEPQSPEEEEGRQEEPQPPPQDDSPPEPAADEQGAPSGQPEERPADEQAAQAVIDAARGEELEPLEIDRPLPGGTGDPYRDW